MNPLTDLFGSIGLALAAFGIGAIVAGWWTRRRWMRKVDDVRIAKLVAVARLHVQLDRAETRAQFSEQQLGYWHRLYLQASTVQRAVVTHIIKEPGESWGDEG